MTLCVTLDTHTQSSNNMIQALTVHPGSTPVTYHVGDEGVKDIDVIGLEGGVIAIVHFSSGQVKKFYNVPFITLETEEN